jgi:hypothetical protein
MESKGLGDTIAKITEATGIAKLTEIVTGALGIEDCGCSRRQNTLNEIFPYSQPTNAPLFNPNEHPKPESGVYEVLFQINARKRKEFFNFVPGDKILMNEEHLLYPDWAYYIAINAVKKL